MRLACLLGCATRGHKRPYTPGSEGLFDKLDEFEKHTSSSRRFGSTPADNHQIGSLCHAKGCNTPFRDVSQHVGLRLGLHVQAASCRLGDPVQSYHYDSRTRLDIFFGQWRLRRIWRVGCGSCGRIFLMRTSDVCMTPWPTVSPYVSVQGVVQRHTNFILQGTTGRWRGRIWRVADRLLERCRTARSPATRRYNNRWPGSPVPAPGRHSRIRGGHIDNVRAGASQVDVAWARSVSATEEEGQQLRGVEGDRRLSSCQRRIMDPEEEERNKKELQKEVVFERRVLFACTCMVGLSVVLWIAAISTNYWFVVDGGAKGIYVNATRRFFLYSHSGLWRICRKSMIPGVPVPGRQPVDSSTVTVEGNVTFHSLLAPPCKLEGPGKDVTSVKVVVTSVTSSTIVKPDLAGETGYPKENSPGTIPTCENPVTRPGIESDSPRPLKHSVVWNHICVRTSKSTSASRPGHVLARKSDTDGQLGSTYAHQRVHLQVDPGMYLPGSPIQMASWAVRTHIREWPVGQYVRTSKSTSASRPGHVLARKSDTDGQLGSTYAHQRVHLQVDRACTCPKVRYRWPVGQYVRTSKSTSPSRPGHVLARMSDTDGQLGSTYAHQRVHIQVDPGMYLPGSPIQMASWAVRTHIKEWPVGQYVRTSKSTSASRPGHVLARKSDTDGQLGSTYAHQRVHLQVDPGMYLPGSPIQMASWAVRTHIKEWPVGQYVRTSESTSASRPGHVLARKSDTDGQLGSTYAHQRVHLQVDPGMYLPGSPIQMASWAVRSHIREYICK
ncbi:hypothetical protein PR048_028346 [Dryococelus australis]|uniref:Uncharacterized protein n=1 Tax=Dryococelus australis TaxID=614101 RepID=A0ABQ9GJ15_9NEOP|nr:hypothetical protein PR048_028346 [Dryococelus australis]